MNVRNLDRLPLLERQVQLRLTAYILLARIFCIFYQCSTGPTLAISFSLVTPLKWSCSATFKSKLSERSEKPIPMKALLPLSSTILITKYLRRGEGCKQGETFCQTSPRTVGDCLHSRARVLVYGTGSKKLIASPVFKFQLYLNIFYGSIVLNCFHFYILCMRNKR